ncbi:MAG TPA: c-type cytochrome [Pyrinomonadaceae bacterium]|jgi:mono/diheme cytochrome c family protein
MIYKCKLLVTLVFFVTAALYLTFEVSRAQQITKPAQPVLQDEAAVAGQKLVQEKCSSCHVVAASNRKDALDVAQKEAPSLAFAGTKFRRQWLEKWLVAPSALRPAGFLSFRFVDAAPTGDRVNDSRIPAHPALTVEEAKIVAAYLMSLKQTVSTVQLAAVNPGARPHIIFEKVLACGACHQVEPGKGGVSGPELFTAGQRLNQEWANAFMIDPLAWSNATMPKAEMRPEQLALISNYVFSADPPPVPAANPVKTAKPDKAPVQLPPERSESLYKVYCSQCHGVNGNGKGINAPALFVAPRNHTSFDEMSILNDDRISAAVKFGGAAVGKSSLMPAWNGILSDADIQLLVAYLRKLSGTQAALNYQNNLGATE